MNWFKLYSEFASDPKVQSMSEAMQRRLIMLMCLQCSGDLEKLDDEELGLALRVGRSDLVKTRELFRRKGFIADTWGLKNWRKRQAPSDPTAAERMRRLRERERKSPRNVTRNVTAPLRVELEVEEDTEGEENPPLPPSIVLGPEFRPVGEFAIQLTADVSWGRWVDQQGMCGHAAATIRRALEEATGAGKLSQAYVAAKLRGWAQEGGPPRRKGEDNGKTAVQQRPEDTAAKLERPDFDALPDTPELRRVREMWGD